jgi:L-aminopeptidase/D-esterase-like protein
MTFRYPPGFRVGHWQDERALTGCTVILTPPATVGGCDVRGSSPGSRELALLASEKTMQEVHALLLTGGSAFGLAAADGVMRFLEEKGVGYGTPWGRVPIVPAAVIFDLNVGSASVRPRADAGYSAAAAAVHEGGPQGSLGAGIGATVGKWAGVESRMRGGIGMATIEHGEMIVTAVAVVNAVGDVVSDEGRVLAGARLPGGRWVADEDPLRRIRIARGTPLELTNTTLVAILTNARLTKVDANRVAQRGHDGLARAIRPVHTSFDGDVVFTLASGPVEVQVDVAAEIAAAAAASAIRSGVLHARALPGVPSAGDGGDPGTPFR